MAEITWVSVPSWGWGSGASPATYEIVCAQMYPYWEDYSKTFAITDISSGAGIYMKSITTGSQGLYGGVQTIKGSVPASAWITMLDEGQPKDGTVLTLVFPDAKRRVSFFCETTYAGGVYTMNIGERWYDTDTNTRVNDITGTGLGVTGGIDGPVHGEPGLLALQTADGTGKVQYGFGVFTATQTSPNRTYLMMYYINIDEYSLWLQAHNPSFDFGTWEVDTTSKEAGPASKQGGYNRYGGDITASDSIAWPSLPAVSAAGLGFINLYNPSMGGLVNLGEEIFPDFNFNSIVDPTGNSIIDAILNACGAFVDCFNQIPQMFKMFINSRLIDYVQDCHIVPVAPTTSGSDHIKLGFRSLDTTADVITTEYVDVSLGSISIDEFYTQFIDYQPFTRAKLFLPFIGFVPLEPEYFQSGSIEVKYRFNVYDGSFICGVLASPNANVSQMSSSMIAQYAGTACVHIPLTGLNYSSMVAGLVGGAGAMSHAIAGNNAGAAVAAAINTAVASPQVMSSNAYTSSAAFLGLRYPFLVIERSVSHFPELYQHDVGFPSKITCKLKSAKGFVTVKDADLSGFQATEEEKAEIRKLLASGIYV